MCVCVCLCVCVCACWCGCVRCLQKSVCPCVWIGLCLQLSVCLYTRTLSRPTHDPQTHAFTPSKIPQSVEPTTAGLVLCFLLEVSIDVEESVLKLITHTPGPWPNATVLHTSTETALDDQTDTIQIKSHLKDNVYFPLHPPLHHTLYVTHCMWLRSKSGSAANGKVANSIPRSVEVSLSKTPHPHCS